jgi:hypothetical protein
MRDVIRGRAIRVDRRICERAGWVNVEVALLAFEDIDSPVTIRLRKAEDDPEDQRGTNNIGCTDSRHQDKKQRER